jgi:hypothetical protein
MVDEGASGVREVGPERVESSMVARRLCWFSRPVSRRWRVFKMSTMMFLSLIWVVCEETETGRMRVDENMVVWQESRDRRQLGQ